MGSKDTFPVQGPFSITAEMFSPDKYAATRRPLKEASPLPWWCYVSQEWYEREVEALFTGPNSEWLCVGRVEQIPKPGDFFTIKIIDHPLIVVRDKGKRVNVFSAICRHRGTVINESPGGNCRAFVCPYHQWTYGLDGALLNIPGTPPPMGAVECFEKADYGLNTITTAFWAGFIFVTFNPNPKPILEWLKRLPDLVKNYEIENMQFVERYVYEVDSNWKVWLENSFENYHAATVHRQFMKLDVPQAWSFEKTDGPFEAMFSQRSIVDYSGLPTLPKLTERESNGLYHIWVQPNLHLVLTKSSMRYRMYLPAGPEKSVLLENWTFPKKTTELPDFRKIAEDNYFNIQKIVADEDLGITNLVQRGLHSRGYKPGRYSTEEYNIHKIANYLLDRVVGPHGGRS